MAMRESEAMVPLALISSWLSAAGGLLLAYRKGTSLLPGPWLGRRLSTYFAVCESLVSRVFSAMHGFYVAAFCAL